MDHDIRQVSPMTKARAEVVMMDPFFGTLLLRMRMKEDPNCRTAWTDGVTIGFNPEYVAKLDPEQRKGLLVHEIMHPVLMHHLRRNNRHPKGWNIACDFALNPLISERYKLPDGALLNPAYSGKSADEIYNLLPKIHVHCGGGNQEGDENQQGNEGGGGENGDDNDPGNCGEVRDNPRNGQSQDQANKQGEAEWKQAIAQARHIAKMQGKMPANLDKLVDDALEPVVEWKNVLRRFASEHARAEESWNRPQRRLLHQGIYLPGLRSEQIGPIAIFRDTSGSIYCSPEALQQFNGEIEAIAMDVKPSSLIVIDVDAAVQQVIEIEPGEGMPPALLQAKGGGGTSFRPPFEYLKEHGIEPKCVIYLTDGYGDFPDENDVEWPTMWVMTTDVEPPFGERVQL
jgi:predicted metal-dependent peptidase